MKTLHINIRDTLLGNEKALMRSRVRASAELIKDYLTDDFTEHCASGVVYKYSDGDRFCESVEADHWFSIDQFDLKILSDTCVHVTYKLDQEMTEGRIRTSLRSSIWVRIEDQWKMKFHQGTIVGFKHKKNLKRPNEEGIDA